MAIQDNAKKAEERQMKLDYTKLPEKVRSAIEPIAYELEIDTALTYDGRQFIVRIPTEIAEEFHITKENRMLFKFVKPSPLVKEKPKLEISVI